MLDLFADEKPWHEPLASGAVILRRFAFESAPALLRAIAATARQSPFRQMVTPGGYTMSVAMTNCGHRFFSKDERIMDWWKTVLPLQGAPSYENYPLTVGHRIGTAAPNE